MKRLFLLASLVLFAFLTGRYYFISGDDGTYLALSRSLHQGEYRAINVPGAPRQAQYPPLLPLLLYPVSAMPAGSLGVARLWLTLFSLFGVWAVARAARERDPALGFLGALPFLVSPLFGEYSTSLITEPLHVALAYFVITNVRVDDKERRFAWSVPVALLAALWLRSASWALAVAVLLAWLLHRRWKEAGGTGAIIAVGMAPWWFWQHFVGGDYVRGHVLQRNIYDPLSGTITIPELLGQRIPGNALRYAGRIMADVLLPPFFTDIAPRTAWFPLKLAVSVLLTLLVLIGFIRLWRRHWRRCEPLYVLVSVGMLLLYPVYSDRYLYSLLPSLIGCALAVLPAAPARRRFAIAWGWVLVIGCLLALAKPVAREDMAYLQAVEWVHEHGEAPATVLARRPTTAWFYTGFASTGYPTSTDYAVWPKDHYYVIRDSYVIGVPSAVIYCDPVMKDTTHFREVFTAPLLSTVKVFEHAAAGL